MKVKLMQEVVRTIRSLKQDYLPPKVKPEGTSVLPPDWEAPVQTARSLRVILDTHPPSDIVPCWSQDGSFRSSPLSFLVPLSRCVAVYVVCKTDEASTTLREFADVTTTLSQCSK